MILNRFRNFKNRFEEEGFPGVIVFYLNNMLFSEQIEFNTLRLVRFLIKDCINKIFKF
jgi:hypothetical protein